MLCGTSACCGCYSCYNICNHNAISLIADEHGFRVPYIDQTKCVQCHLCEKVCPVLNTTNGNKPQKCYAAWSLSRTILNNSASGGIASVLYRKIAQLGGKRKILLRCP